MLYDLAEGPPRPGTLLESVFLLIAKRRQEAQLRQTHVLVAATLAPHAENGSKFLSDALKEYRNSLMPFLEKMDDDRKVNEKKLLAHWANKVFRVRPMHREHGNKAWSSKLRKGAERVQQLEAARRDNQLRRI